MVSTDVVREGAETGEGRTAPHLDVVFEMLRNSRRRHVLRYLDEEASTTIGDLAEHIAAIENGVPESELRSAQRKRVYVSLYQSHLPKLDEAGVVSFDDDRGTVEPSDDLDRYLSYLDQFESPAGSPRRSLAAWTLTGAGLAGAALAMGVVSVVSGETGEAIPAVESGLVLVAVGLTALGYRWYAGTASES